MRDTREILRFGDFELRVASGELAKGGVAVALQPRPMSVLAYMASRPGELVTRGEIQISVWGEGVHLQFDQALNYSIRRIRAALGDDAKEPSFLETLPRRGYRFIAPVTSRVVAPAGVETELSVVVLPFVDFSEEPQEYFSDGLTEEMINELGRLQPRRLRVIARTSTMQYKGTRKSVREIGGELGVDHALEGSVRRASGQVRVSAQLVRVSDESQVWAGSYDADPGDLLGVQRQVAQALAREIWPTLLPRQGSTGSRRLDPEVYEQYLKGRYFWHRRTVSDLWKGIHCFARATELDAKYAAAHAGLADVYLTLLDYHELPAREALGPAKLAVAEALRLDSTLSEAHSTLGHLSLHLYDWVSAESAFRRAIELNPSYAMAHFYLANYLLARGRFEEAIKEGMQTMALDPVAAIVESNAAFVYYHAGRHAEALARCRRALEMDASSWAAHYDQGRVYVELGEPRRAIEELELAVELSGHSHRALAALGHALGIFGERARAEAILEQLERSEGRRPWSYGVALVLLSLGRLDEGLGWLEQGYDELDAGLVFLAVDPRMRAVRSHPRVGALLEHLGLG